VDTGIDCGPRTEGEILLRGPNIMKGYFENSDANVKAFEGSWLKTGESALQVRCMLLKKKTFRVVFCVRERLIL